jgi:hypothetical protein
MDRLASFSEAEFAQALSLALAESEARVLASRIASLPPDELANFDIMEPTLFLLSLVSPDCERKVLELFTTPGEDREGFVGRQAEFAEWIRQKPEKAWGWTMEDVLFDRRSEQSG